MTENGRMKTTVDIPEDELKEVNRSAYVYGLPDLSTLTMATAGDRSKLTRQVIAAINLFEPRLANVRVVFVETEDAYGPFGAKTLGEPTIIPAVAAVANAFFNATGRRVKSLPMTRDKVLGVLA